MAKLLPALLFLLAPLLASAQPDWPSKPLRIVVPYSAGGGADILARMIGQQLSERLHQPVVIENRAGASNTLGMQAVAIADKDGYTLGLATPVFVMTPLLMRSQPYDPLKDFLPVGMIGFTPLVLAVHPAVAATTPLELVALARATPGLLNYASLGAATTQGLAASLFKFMAGMEAVEVPYKGSAPGVSDLVAGNVQFMFNALPSMLPLVKAGRLRALGVTSARPAPQLPGVPTVGATVPGYEVVSWYTLVAPAGTPTAIVERLNHEMGEALKSRDFIERLGAQAVQPDPMSPQALGEFLRSESEKWARVVREAKILAE